MWRVMHVCKQDIECDAEIVREFPLCRKDFGDDREIKIEKKCSILKTTQIMWKIRTLWASCFPLERLLAAKPMCIETNMTINLAWVKCNLHLWDVITLECLMVICFIGMCCAVRALGKPHFDCKTLQPRAGKTLALGAVPGNLFVLPGLKTTGLSAVNEYESGTWVDPVPCC